MILILWCYIQPYRCQVPVSCFGVAQVVEVLRSADVRRITAPCPDLGPVVIANFEDHRDGIRSPAGLTAALIRGIMGVTE